MKETSKDPSPEKRKKYEESGCSSIDWESISRQRDTGSLTSKIAGIKQTAAQKIQAAEQLCKKKKEERVWRTAEERER